MSHVLSVALQCRGGGRDLSEEEKEKCMLPRTILSRPSSVPQTYLNGVY